MVIYSFWRKPTTFFAHVLIEAKRMLSSLIIPCVADREGMAANTM